MPSRRKMKENVTPAEGAYIESDSDAAGELNSGAAPFNKSADRDTVSEGDAPFNKDFPPDLDKDATGTGDAVDEGPAVYNKAGWAHDWTTTQEGGSWYLTNGISSWWGPSEEGWRTEEQAIQAFLQANPKVPVVDSSNRSRKKEQGDDMIKDATGTGDAVDEGPAAFNKDSSGTGDAVDDGPAVYNKDVGGPCVCGADAPPGANFCPGCGAAMGKADALPPNTVDPTVTADIDPTVDPTAVAMDVGPDATVTAGVDDIPGDIKGDADLGNLPADAATTDLGDAAPAPDMPKDVDPNADEILERYRNPKSNTWDVRKWTLHKKLLPYLKYRVAADGQKYFVKAVDDVPAVDKEDVTPSQGEQVVGSGQLKEMANRLGKAIEDIKALFNGPDLPKHYRPALKHVADVLFYVGKELTDAGKLQRNGGSGTALSDKGKVQRNGGGGSALFGGGNGSLESTGSQQGKSPAKSWADSPADPLVVARLNSFEQFCKRQGIIDGSGSN